MFAAGSSSWVSNEVAGLGIAGPFCLRGPARDECGRGGCRADEKDPLPVVRDADRAADVATLFARPCIFGAPVVGLDVVLPVPPIFRVSGAWVVLFERVKSAIPSAPSELLLLLLHPVSFSIRDEVDDDDDCLAIVPGGKRPERELVKAELTSFNPPGTRARVGALEFVYTEELCQSKQSFQTTLHAGAIYQVLVLHNGSAMFVDKRGDGRASFSNEA